MSRAHLIVVGNAKGGSGKSTTANHLVTRLLCQGHKVGVLDLDARQQTLTRYLENRALFGHAAKVPLPQPTGCVVAEERRCSDADNHARLCATLEPLLSQQAFVVVDCPGSDTYLTRVAHGFADTIVTPINDSFIDVDLLARVDPHTFKILEPSWYSEMVFTQRKRRQLTDQHAIDWVVLRNRLSHTDARNKRHVGQVLQALCGPLGFRFANGLGERVIFRELFLKGLTLSDVRQFKTGVQLSMSHVAAHQEVRDLVNFLKLPGAKTPLKNVG